MTNAEKAREILDCENCKKQLLIGGVKCPPTCADYNDLMKIAQWKDEQLSKAIDELKEEYLELWTNDLNTTEDTAAKLTALNRLKLILLETNL